MRKKFLIATALLLVTLAAFSISYDPDMWTTCITSGTTMGGEPVENNYYCYAREGSYDGEDAIISTCELNGFGDPGCSGNSLGFYPAMQ